MEQAPHPVDSFRPTRAHQIHAAATSFLALFSIVGLALYGLPQFYDHMVREFGWSRTQVTSGNAISKLIVGPLPNQVLLSRWFRQGRGKAMGFAYLGIGLGGAAVPWLSYWLAAAEPRAGTGDGALLGAVLRRPPFYLLAAGSMCSIAAVGGANQHLKLFLGLDQGYSPAEAARIISLVLTFSIAGRLLMGWLADHWPKRRVMLLIYVLVAAAIPLLFFAPSRPAMYLFAALFGIGLGGEYLIIPLMAAELFGVAVLGRVMGILVTADGVAEAVSPMAIGYLRDVTGSDGVGFTALIAVALLGAAAITMLPARPGGPGAPAR